MFTSELTNAIIVRCPYLSLEASRCLGTETRVITRIKRVKRRASRVSRVPTESGAPTEWGAPTQWGVPTEWVAPTEWGAPTEGLSLIHI